jgi:hypothetical protein
LFLVLGFQHKRLGSFFRPRKLWESGREEKESKTKTGNRRADWEHSEFSFDIKVRKIKRKNLSHYYIAVTFILSKIRECFEQLSNDRLELRQFAMLSALIH